MKKVILLATMLVLCTYGKSQSPLEYESLNYFKHETKDGCKMSKTGYLRYYETEQLENGYMNYYMLESCLNDKNVAVYIFVKSGNLKVYFSIPLKWNSDLIKEEFEKNKKKIDKKLFDVITLKAIVFLLNNTENKDKSTFTPNQPS